MPLYKTMKFAYMAMMPFGERFGDECMDFVNLTVCFMHTVPYIVPAYVELEPVQQFEAVGGCQRSAPWHLSRMLDLRPRNMDYRWDGDGSEIDVYVLDTWIDCKHDEFENRCRELKRFAPHRDGARPSHGTHVAGLVGSSEHGVAKRANIKSVPVLDDEGSGWYDDFIKALQFVVQTIRRASNKRAIVNMSLKGPKSRIMDRVVEDMRFVAVMVIAAGNDNVDACELSPTARGVAIVGSTNIDNRLSSFSNYGKCVTINAPGESILSLCPNNLECWMSGTSMAAPITAGAIAVYWDNKLAQDPVEVWKGFLNQAVRGKLVVRGGTPNLFSHLEARSRCMVEDTLDMWRRLSIRVQ